MLKLIKCFRSNKILTNNYSAVLNSLETSKCYKLFFINCKQIIPKIYRYNELKFVHSILDIIDYREMPRRVFQEPEKNSYNNHKTRKKPLKRKRLGRKCKAAVSFDSDDSELEYIQAPKQKLVEDNSCKIEKTEVSSASSDELQVVYDLQEDKKNRVYEVITVTSDDESIKGSTNEECKAEKITSNTVPVVEDDIVCLGVYKNEYNFIPKNQCDSIVSDPNFSYPLDLTNYVNFHHGFDNVGLFKGNNSLTNKVKRDVTNEVEEVMLSSGSESTSSWATDDFGSRSDDFNETQAENKACLKLKVRKSTGMNYAIVNEQDSNFPVLSSASSNDVDSERSSSRSSSNSITRSNSDSSSDVSSKISCDGLSSAIPSWKEAEDNKNKAQLRYEEFTELGQKYRSGEGKADGHNMIINLMSYNVLSQCLLDRHRELYKWNSARTLTWELRWQLIYDEIENERPDILCMQEVEESYLNDYYNQLLSLGYDYIYKKRTGTQIDGCAIYYNQSKFDLERHTALEFYNHGTFSLSRDNIALVARFRPKDSREDAIVVATTHLLYNPKRYDVRLAQMELLLAEIDKLAYNKKTKTYYPIILTGDFNETPQGSVYQLVTQGNFRFEGLSYKSLQTTGDHTRMSSSLIPQWKGITDNCQYVTVMKERKTKCQVKDYTEAGQPNFENELSEDNINECFSTGRLSHDLKLTSVYKTVKEDGSLEATTLHDSWITVDYIFYSLVENSQTKQLEEGNLKLLSRIRLPTRQQCKGKIRSLPNFAHGSDHLSLAAKFLLQLKVPSED